MKEPPTRVKKTRRQVVEAEIEEESTARQATLPESSYDDFKTSPPAATAKPEVGRTAHQKPRVESDEEESEETASSDDHSEAPRRARGKRTKSEDGYMAQLVDIQLMAQTCPAALKLRNEINGIYQELEDLDPREVRKALIHKCKEKAITAFDMVFACHSGILAPDSKPTGMIELMLSDATCGDANLFFRRHNIWMSQRFTDAEKKQWASTILELPWPL